MIRMICRTLVLIAVLAGMCAAQTSQRVTILYDAFTRRPDVATDWGFAALVEFGGKRILFDTGNDPARLERNVKQLGVDLAQLDFVVISHRHGDHTLGLKYLLAINPRVEIYVPADEYFGGPTPSQFFTRNPDDSLPPEMRYFKGHVPSNVPHGTPWMGANFVHVTESRTVSPNIRLVATVSEKPGTKELRELSMVLDTAEGSVLITGCSHAGIENILAAATADAPRHHVSMIVGGLHLVEAAPPEIDRTMAELFDHYKVESMAPGHCTGERAFALLRRRLGKRYVYAGVGEVVPL